MKKLIDFIVNNPNNLYLKAGCLLIFIFLFTGTDLLVKQVVKTRLENKPEHVIIPDYLGFYYVENDDIGFSALRWIDKYFAVPGKIKTKTFENKILNKIEKPYLKVRIKQYYNKKGDKFYVLKDNLSSLELEYIKRIFRLIDYRTSKWILLVLIQGLATAIVILFFFKSRKWNILIPIALIISGALGNLLERIIRGYVVDFVKSALPFIPDNMGFLHRLFNPWPIFNLADIYTVIGTIILFIVIFFFTKETDS